MKTTEAAMNLDEYLYHCAVQEACTDIHVISAECGISIAAAYDDWADSDDSEQFQAAVWRTLTNNHGE